MGTGVNSQPCLKQNLPRFSSPSLWGANRIGKQCGMRRKHWMNLACLTNPMFFLPIAPRTRPQSLPARLPVLGVPIQSKALQGLDSLLSISQMPGGIPVGTLAIGNAGAKNAALLAASIIAVSDAKVRRTLQEFRKKQTDAVLAQRVP